MVPAELFSAGYIFVAMVFKFFQNRIQFRNDGIKCFIQLLVHLFLHKLVNGFGNDIGLIGQELLHFFSLSRKKLLHLFLGHCLERLLGLVSWWGWFGHGKRVRWLGTLSIGCGWNCQRGLGRAGDLSFKRNNVLLEQRENVLPGWVRATVLRQGQSLTSLKSSQ